MGVNSSVSCSGRIALEFGRLVELVQLLIHGRPYLETEIDRLNVRRRALLLAGTLRYQHATPHDVYARIARLPMRAIPRRFREQSIALSRALAQRDMRRAIFAGVPPTVSITARPIVNPSGTDSTVECAICMDTLCEQDIVEQCPNKHAFHRICMCRWNTAQCAAHVERIERVERFHESTDVRFTCPLCRFDMGRVMLQ
jgi:hypothetical protein